MYNNIDTCVTKPSLYFLLVKAQLLQCDSIRGLDKRENSREKKKAFIVNLLTYREPLAFCQKRAFIRKPIVIEDAVQVRSH